MYVLYTLYIVRVYIYTHTHLGLFTIYLDPHEGQIFPIVPGVLHLLRGWHAMARAARVETGHVLWPRAQRRLSRRRRNSAGEWASANI